MLDVFCLIREVENRSQRSDLRCDDVAREIDIIQGGATSRRRVFLSRCPDGG